MPLIFGSGHYSTKLSIEMRSEGAGARGIRDHRDPAVLPEAIQGRGDSPLREVRRAVDLPIMLHNNPANSACVDLTPREVAQLVEGRRSPHGEVPTIGAYACARHFSIWLAIRDFVIFMANFRKLAEAMCAEPWLDKRNRMLRERARTNVRCGRSK